jgi:hypothetical protein
MNILKCVLALILGTLLLSVSSVRASAIRTGSSYGTGTGAFEPVVVDGATIGEEWIFTDPPGTDTNAVILQIFPTSTDLGQSLQVTLPSGTGAFGLVDCSSPGNLGPGTAENPAQNDPCNDGLAASVAGTSCNLASQTFSGSAVLDGSTCDVAGETFYFDEGTSTSFATVTLGGAVPVPESSSLLMLSIGLIPLAFLSRRRPA